MSQFIESIKIEHGIPALLELHQERIDKTFAHFKHNNPILLTEILPHITFNKINLYKWRVVYNLNGNYYFETTHYERKEIKDFQLVYNNHINYSFKYNNRAELNQMKQGATAEEIIIAKNGMITDTSFSNLLFLKNGEWFTPKSYLLNGVQRQFLLKENLIKEMEISLDNINDFSHFQLINAMNSMNEGCIYPLNRLRI